MEVNPKDVHDSAPTLEEIRLEVLRFSTRYYVTKYVLDHADVKYIARIVGDSLAYEVHVEIAGRKNYIYRPANWWEHFKDRWFPDWLLKRFPVKREQIVVRQLWNHLGPPSEQLGTPYGIIHLVEENAGIVADPTQ